MQTHKKTETVNLVDLIKNKALFREAAYINGQWKTGAKAIDVTNPSDGSLLGQVPDFGKTETEDAIKAADDAFADWSTMLAKDRGRILRRWADLMLDNKEDLALIMTLEQGKPLNESRGEVDYALSFFEWFGEEAKRAYGDTIPTHLQHSQMLVSKHPVGVTAAITPWNFPSAMITRKAGAALAAGCTMVVRPASETPYSALALAVLGEQAGVPKGVFSVITGDGPTIGGTLCDSTTVRKISFTGSTEVGRILLKQSADTVKKMSMELGGHAPFIAFDDCDMDLVIPGAIGAKFATTGQDCLAANRIYVHDAIYDEFAEKFTAGTAAMKMDDGLVEGADLGPLMNESAVLKCEEHVKDALDKGAKLLTGGERHEKGGLFYKATVLGDVTPEMKIYHEETFGPVAALIRFSDEADVIKAANDSEYGLAAYVYSNDIGRCHRVSNALDYGMVGVNTPKFTGSAIPFGGFKQSGLGREGSHYGLDDYMEIKYICLGNLDARA
ncbi:MAG: NAD-dependent succinate-semialdehyde dehydrogenase [Pseudomonadota bacterium]